MKEKSVFAKSSAAASALFVLGNGIIVLPANKTDEYTVLEFLAVALIAVALSALLLPIAQKLSNSEDKNCFSKILKLSALVILSIGAAFSAADTFSDFTGFISAAVLPSIAKPIITAVFFIVVIYFALKRQEDTLKFAFISLSFSLIAIIFFFLATMENFDLRNIFVFRLPELKEFIHGTKPYIIKAALPSLILPFYTAFVFGSKKSGSLLGSALGFLLLGLCILTSVLLFSPKLAGRLSYPYFSAVSTVTVGKLFTRMDGFSYLIYFVSSITKINICSFTAFSSMKKINQLI